METTFAAFEVVYGLSCRFHFEMVIQYDSYDGIIIVIVEMIANLKVKITPAKEDSTRRIRTEANENTKKISLYTNPKPKVPLAENRKQNNES